MKIKMISLIVLLAVNSALFAQHNFSVEVSGVEPGKGFVFLGLYDKEKGFLDNESQIATAKVKLQKIKWFTRSKTYRMAITLLLFIKT